MRGIALSLWWRRRFTKRVRFRTALLTALFILGAMFFYWPSVAPRYLFTLNGQFSFFTPRGFMLGQLYDFSNPVFSVRTDEAQVSNQSPEWVFSRPDNKSIIFKYPKVITLGRPTYLGSDITQSVDFNVKEPPASGLIQVWILNTSLDDFLEASKNNSAVEYLTFSTRKQKENALSATLWDYTFISGERTIRGLEAFFDDKPYMYRLSIFMDNKDYGKELQDLFSSMVQSVKVK